MDRNSLDMLKAFMMGAANPGSHSKYNDASGVVYLHLPEKRSKSSVVPALQEQLHLAEMAIDRALLSNRHEVRLIHGLGSGKLKNALHQMLRKHPQVKSFSDAYHPSYGNGSTLVLLK